MDITLVISAFIAGFLMVLAPCTLPIVPAYLGFISGVSAADLRDARKVKDARRKIFLNGLFFIAGFSVIFIFFGALAGFFGAQLAFARVWLSRIGGIFVIFFGLFLLGIFRLPFLRTEKRLRLPAFFTVGTPRTSFLIGSSFAFGWTPCVGPILGSILLLASTSATIFQGIILLSVFSMGLAVPFLVIAAGAGQATRVIAKIAPYLYIVEMIGGIFLIALGFLLLTNNFSILIEYGYGLFDFIGYERLLDYL